METIATLRLLLEETRKIYTLLAERSEKEQLPTTEEPAPPSLPEHMDVEGIIGYFGISNATFYNEVRNKLLFPAVYIGKRPYYLKSDVVKLMMERKKTHLGFRKLNALRRKTGKKAIASGPEAKDSGPEA